MKIVQASTEHNHFWLAALRDCCMAESCLLSDDSSMTQSDFAARMFRAESHYHTGIVALKVIRIITLALLF